MRASGILALGCIASASALVVAACSKPRLEAPAPAASASSNADAASGASAIAYAPPDSAAAETTSDPAGEPPLPDGFVRIAEQGETSCAGLRVQVLAEEPADAWHRFVRVLGPDGARIYEAHGRAYELAPGVPKQKMDLRGELCGDLTGDGVPEVLLTEKTEGAHCCYTHYVVSMGSPPKRLLMWDKGDAGTPVLPVRYRPGPSWQLEGRVVLEPPDPSGELGLSYASMPLVPVVLSLEHDRYMLTSLSFPEAYRKHRDEIHAGCDKGEDECAEVTAWIDSLALGDWSAEKPRMRDARVREALERRTPAMKSLLAKLGSVQRPVAP